MEFNEQIPFLLSSYLVPYLATFRQFNNKVIVLSAQCVMYLGFEISSLEDMEGNNGDRCTIANVVEIIFLTCVSILVVSPVTLVY